MSSTQTASLLPPERLGSYPPAGLRDTVTCRQKSNGRVVKINSVDFGGKLYPKSHYLELTGDDLDELTMEDTTPEAPPVKHSLFTKEDMNMPSMRIQEIKSLPEYEQISTEARKKLRTKQQVIDAILQVRADVPETPTRRATF